MAQNPLQIDALQIEPGSAGTRRVDRDSATGDLRFTDPSNPAGILLSELAGLRSIQNVMTVGLSGSGAQFNTIQEALDAVLASSSLTDPTLILVGPGVYSENLVIEKDGIWVHGLGGAVLNADIADATITIQSAVGTDPNWCRLQNLRIQNTYAGEECVLIVGGAGSVVGSEEIGIIDCDLVATGLGTFQVRATAINTLRVQGGSFDGSSSSSLLRVADCHRVSLSDLDRVLHLQLDYDTANALPSVVGSSYQLKNLTLAGNVLSTLNGGGSLSVGGCYAEAAAGALTFNGDGVGTFRVAGGNYGDVTVNGSAPVTMSAAAHGVVLGATPAVLDEDYQIGSLAFVASASEAVVFSPPQSDANYRVHVETELTEPVSVTGKLSTGFTLNFAGPQNTTVFYSVSRRIS